MALTLKQALAMFWEQIQVRFVKRENGKGLSTNDFTNEEKTKLASLTAGANGTITNVIAGDGLTGGGTSGSVTLNIAADRGLSISSDKIGHSNSVTAATAQGSATKTLTFGDTFTIPTVTYDAQGHITAKGTTTMTMPANPNIDTGATSIQATGSGNAVTGATFDAATRKITLNKDATYLASSLKGIANGVAELDSTGKIPTSQLPAYVDDVLEYTTKNSFPLMGETGKIYVDLTTNLAWRWGGSTYVEISPSLALGETSSTAYRGDRGKIAYDHAQAKGVEKANGFYKITTNAEGHVTVANAVTQSDIVALGMATEDFVTSAYGTITEAEVDEICGATLISIHEVSWE